MWTGSVSEGSSDERLVVVRVVRGLSPELPKGAADRTDVAPMMGMPLFSGSPLLAGGSLVGHIVYGAVIGGVIGNAPAAQPAIEVASS